MRQTKLIATLSARSKEKAVEVKMAEMKKQRSGCKWIVQESRSSVETYTKVLIVRHHQAHQAITEAELKKQGATSDNTPA